MGFAAHALSEVIPQADVIMMLRFNWSAWAGFFPTLREYSRFFGLTWKS